jgi:hypothetical protein
MQRWFGAALEEAFPDRRVHAEVHAVASDMTGRTLRTDLTLHRKRSGPFLDDRDVTTLDVELCLELKVLRVGRSDRHWRSDTLANERVSGSLASVVGDLDKRSRGGCPVLGALFVEPLSYSRQRDDATRIAERIAVGARAQSLHLLHPLREDATPVCLALLARHPFMESR